MTDTPYDRPLINLNLQNIKNNYLNYCLLETDDGLNLCPQYC